MRRKSGREAAPTTRESPIVSQSWSSAPGGSRTPDLRIRRTGTLIGQTGVMTGFFRNSPQLRAGLGPRESTGIHSIPRYFGHDLDTVCAPRPSGGKSDGRLRQAAALE